MEVWVEVNGPPQFSTALLFHQSNLKDLIWILLASEMRHIAGDGNAHADCDLHTAQYSASPHTIRWSAGGHLAAIRSFRRLGVIH